MNWFSKLISRETRDSVSTADPYLAEFLGQRPVSVGSVDPMRASGLPVALACISTISQNLASVPLPLFVEKEGKGRSKDRESPLFHVLNESFNPHMTAYEGREFLITSLLTHGNAFAEIRTDEAGRVTALHPIHPGNVVVDRLQSGKARYTVTRQIGTQVLLADEMLHIRYRVAPDGILGLSPLQLARETFSLAMTQQEQAARQSRRSFRTEGAMIFPQTINADGKEAALNQLANRLDSEASTSGVLVLDGGAEWKSLSLSSKDAEFLDNRKLSNMDIARIFNVPPTVAGITDNATYSNVDGESRALVVRCLAPTAKRIEQALNASLLISSTGSKQTIEHDLAGLLRGDMKTRFEAYRIGREMGWLSANEIRAWENLPEIENGDRYLEPLNMSEAGSNHG